MSVTVGLHSERRGTKKLSGSENGVLGKGVVSPQAAWTRQVYCPGKRSASGNRNWSSSGPTKMRTSVGPSTSVASI